MANFGQQRVDVRQAFAQMCWPNSPKSFHEGGWKICPSPPSAVFMKCYDGLPRNSVG